MWFVGVPRFKPARVCANPRHYARVEKPSWAVSSGLSPSEVAWAVFQHRAAFAVLESLKASGLSLEWLASGLREDVAWLRRKLYGQTPADLGDVMGWALLIGVDVLPVFDDSSELKPVGSS